MKISDGNHEYEDANKQNFISRSRNIRMSVRTVIDTENARIVRAKLAGPLTFFQHEMRKLRFIILRS